MDNRPMELGEATRKWISGLAVTLTTIISYMAFWHLAPLTTLIIGIASLATLVAILWFAGKRRDNANG